MAIRYCYADSTYYYIPRKNEILEMGQEKKNQERKSLKSFYYKAVLVEANMQSWGGDDAGLYESDTALRKRLVGNDKST